MNSPPGRPRRRESHPVSPPGGLGGPAEIPASGGPGGTRILVRLLGLAAPYAWWMVLAGLLGFATIGSSIGLMAASAYIISKAALQPSIAELQVAIAGVRFFGISRGLFRYLERYVSHQVTFSLLAGLRVWFYRALEPLAPARLMSYRSGDLLGRIVADIETLEHVYVRVLSPPAAAGLVMVLAGLLLAAYHPRLALVGLLCLGLAGAGLPLLAHRLSRGQGARLVGLRADLNSALVDGVLGAADLLAYGQESRHLERVAGLSRELARGQVRLGWQNGLHTALSGLVINLATLAILLAAIPLVSAGRLDGVYLAVVVLALIASFEAILPLPAAFQYLEHSTAAAERLFELVDAPPAVGSLPSPPEGSGVKLSQCHSFRWSESLLSRSTRSGQGQITAGNEKFLPVTGAFIRRLQRFLLSLRSSRPVPGTRQVNDMTLLTGPPVPDLTELPPPGGPAPTLTVEHLWFRYEPDQPPALADLSFELPPGGRLALVGPSGAGKSSLVYLLLRFWEYQQGRIYVSGREVRTCSPEQVRAWFAVVSQSTHLFTATIRENLLLARPEAGPAELDRAVQQARLWDFIQSLPHGYDTWLGEHGLGLSGGERQRLAIARAILKNAPFLILDEATANLDPLVEQNLIADLYRLMEGRSTLVCTHRLVGLEAMDEILVLQAGRVVERGRHHDLLQAGGVYRRLWDLQRRFD